MLVTKVESVTKTKYRVELDQQFAFVLYKGELAKFGIREMEEIPEEQYEKIRTEVILKRAKLRAMHLLTDMARTESGLREKQTGDPCASSSKRYPQGENRSGSGKMLAGRGLRGGDPGTDPQKKSGSFTGIGAGNTAFIRLFRA